MIYTKVEMNIFARHAMNTALDNIIDHKSISITSDKLHQRLPIGVQNRQRQEVSPTQCNGVIFS